MAAWDVLSACARRWYVVLVGLMATGTVLGALAGLGGVASAQAEVVFLAPPTPANPNRLASAATGVVATAGLVERLVNQGVAAPATSDSVTLLGRGVRDGSSVVLPDSGGQWAQNFERPVLVVQVTGPAPDAVNARLLGRVAEVERVLQNVQADQGVRPRHRITSSVVPAEPRVQLEQGYRGRALGTALLLGLALTTVAAVTLDRVLRGRQRRRGRGQTGAGPA